MVIPSHCPLYASALSLAVSISRSVHSDSPGSIGAAMVSSASREAAA